MAELRRQTFQVESLKNEQFVLHTVIDKIGGDNVFLTLKRAKNPAICPVHWFKHWWNIQKSRSNNGQILR
ncbi:MAG: hypothetical protein EZS28_053493 [Streblomastix strix]|uniref:Uncharacterized protein n=1 Tax=Streblomastix strix TaxID=222440 RepID=A0A5J4R9V4_9EUKA|nr:MAG: hypothetical protein EZS28_053493 [Streblomastix strix]